MKDTSTKFPQEIDSRTFFQDICIDQVPIMKEYYKLLNAGNYDMTSDLLNNSEVSFYGAWLLNMWENRLNAVGEYVMKLEKPKLITYQSTEPTNPYQGMHWID